MNSRALINIIDNLESSSITDALSANQGRVLNITKQDKIVDTGWKNITLSEGIVTYGPTTIPQYRKIGNVVYIRGAVKNILTANTIVGVLPEEARPTGANHNYLMPTTNNNGANFARIVITAAGQIKIESISSNLTASYGESRWFPINTSYIVD